MSARFNQLFGDLVSQLDRHSDARSRRDIDELYESRRRLDDIRYALALERSLRL